MEADLAQTLGVYINFVAIKFDNQKLTQQFTGFA